MDPDVHAEHGTSLFQKATVTPGELDHPNSLQITRADRTPGPNDLPLLLPGINDKPRHVPEEDYNSEGSTEQHGKLVAPDDSSEKEVVRLQHERIADLEVQLSDTLAERDRHVSQLTDELALKSAQLEEAAEEVKHARLELRELHAKLDESLLSRDHALEQAQSALQEASCAAEVNEQTQRELTEMHAELEARKSETVAFRLRLADMENGYAKSKAEAVTGLRELQAKLDESLLSRDHALEQAQSALQKASHAAEANEQSQRELKEMRAELEVRKSESVAFRLQLADKENNCSKSKTEADTYRTQTETGLVNTEEGRAVHRLMERVRVMEAEMASMRWNEKSFEMMECRNEG